MRSGWFERALERAAKQPAKRRHWSLRTDVVFDDANDHNPIVFDECPACRGGGCHSESGRDEDGNFFHQRVRCGECRGTGTTGQRVRYFDNDRSVAEVPLRNGRSVTCPCCGWSFLITDRTVWTGLRHVRCGQRIRPIGGDARAEVTSRE